MIPVELSAPGGGRIVFGAGNPLVLIAGPCIIESEEHAEGDAPDRGRVTAQGAHRLAGGSVP